MASGKNKNGLDSTRDVSRIVSSIEDNTDLSQDIYLAEKTIYHDNRIFKKGDSVEISGEALQRLIKVGAVKLQDDGFPRVN